MSAVLERYDGLIAGAKRSLEYANDVGHEPAEIAKREARIAELEAERAALAELIASATQVWTGDNVTADWPRLARALRNCGVDA